MGRKEKVKARLENFWRVLSWRLPVSLSPVLLILLLCVSTTSAETISSYRSKIHGAKLLVDNLYYADEDEAGAKSANAERETIRRLRAALPATEKIEDKGVNLETQNKWFAESLDAYEKETDQAKKRLMLAEISERLGALEAKVSELESATAAARSKDEDKRKLSEILSREEFKKPAPPEENILQRTWRKIREWLSSVFPRSSPFSLPTEGLSSLSTLLQILVYALVLGVIGFLVYKFAPFLSRKFGRFKKETKSDRVILGETLAADADSHTLFTEAENLARAGNLRGAIRKGYIALLCDLSDRKIIGLAKNKTNRDYLRDVRPRTEIFDDMQSLTTNFERHWYGFGSPEEKDWDEFRDKYRTVIKN
jgi:hypothetical protein